MVKYYGSMNKMDLLEFISPNLIRGYTNLEYIIPEITSSKPTKLKPRVGLLSELLYLEEQPKEFIKKNRIFKNLIIKEEYFKPLNNFKFIAPEPKSSGYAPCGEIQLSESEPCTLGVEIPQVSNLYRPIKVARKQALGRLRFGETERSNIILETMSQLFNYAAQHERDLTWHLDDAKIDVTGPKVDRVFFETSDGAISGSIVYLRNGLLTRDKIRTVVHFNSEDEKDMNEYLGLHKLLLELNTKKHPNKEVVIPFTPKKYEGESPAPAGR